MAVNLSPVAGAAAQFFDNSGNVLTGGKLYTYDAGTTTPAVTYTSSSGVTAQPNPIVLNAAGRVPDSGEIWLADGISYKFVLKDANDVLIATYDNLSGINSNFVNFTGQEETQIATQGQTVFTLVTLNYQPATNNLLVFVNGSKQISGDNYAETSSTVITFVDGLNVGDVVDFCTATPINTNVVTAAQVSYTYPDGNAVTESVQDRLAQYVSVKDFGAIGDSNGTTGNGTDDTVAIQNAVDMANATGKLVYIPVGRYRITAPIDFTGAQTKTGFVGESNFNSIIFADFTSGSAVAALSLDNTAGARAYVAFKNFRLEGLNHANVSGIYTNYGSEFTELENVWVLKFANGIVVANDYNTRITRCLSWYNTYSGFQIGYTLAGVVGAANNVTLLGCSSTNNGANGYYVYACRALAMAQCDAEANKYTNIYLDTVYGASLTGTYMEFSNTLPANPQAQLWLKSCTGISVDGLSVSAFDNNTNYVISVTDGCNGVDLNAIAIETAGSPTNAIGVFVSGSFGVTIQNSYFNALSSGVYLLGNCRLNIASTNFSNCTLPVATDGTGSKQLVWNDAVGSELTASASNIGSEAIVDVCTIDNQKNQINLTKAFNISVSYSNLASLAKKNLITPVFINEQWRIVDIFAVGVTGFSGGGNDRTLNITDGTHSYSVIPAANLQSSTTQARWGSTAVPYSAVTSDMVQPTTAGLPLYAQYAGGTSDYTAGIINLTIVAERIA